MEKKTAWCLWRGDLFSVNHAIERAGCKSVKDSGGTEMWRDRFDPVASREMHFHHFPYLSDASIRLV